HDHRHPGAGGRQPRLLRPGRAHQPPLTSFPTPVTYIQLLFSFFNAPLIATFILAMFWKRTTPWSGIAGLAAGTIGAAAMHFAGYHIAYFYPHQVLDPTHVTINAQMLNFYGAIAAFVLDLVVT